MARTLTIYWTPKGWEDIPEGSPIRTAAGNAFDGKVQAGDRVYVTNVKNGRLRLLGALEVERIEFAQTAYGKQRIWEKGGTPAPIAISTVG